MSDIEALCVRTNVIGAGNHFEVLIPLSDIDPEGHTYQVIRSTENDRPYVPFVIGIEPYTTEIMSMQQGADRYHAYNIHEAAAKLKEIAILRQAFPESSIDATAILLWNDEHLPDKEVRLKISRDGMLLPSADSRLTSKMEPQP